MRRRRLAVTLWTVRERVGRSVGARRTMMRNACQKKCRSSRETHSSSRAGSSRPKVSVVGSSLLPVPFAAMLATTLLFSLLLACSVSASPLTSIADFATELLAGLQAQGLSQSTAVLQANQAAFQPFLQKVFESQVSATPPRGARSAPVTDSPLRTRTPRRGPSTRPQMLLGLKSQRDPLRTRSKPSVSTSPESP